MGAPTDGMAIYEEWQVQFATQANARLAQIASGGFQLVMNYASLFGHSTDLINYANYAQGLGLKIIWALHDTAIWLNNQQGSNNALYNTYTLLCSSAGLTNITANDQTFTTYVVNLVMNHPATWGYYIGDEVVTANHSALLSHANYIKAADSHHPRIYIAGGSDLTSSFASGKSIFSDVAEVIGDDYYPLGYTLLQWLNAEEEATGIQQYANKYNLQSAIVSQATSWVRYYPPARSFNFPYDAPYPSALYMQEQRNICQNNMQPRIMLWYNYFDLLLSDNPGAHWSDLCWAVNGIGTPSTQTLIAEDIFTRSNQSGWGASAANGDVWTQPLGTLTSSVSSVTGMLTGSTDTNIFLLGTGKIVNPTIIMRFVLSNINTGTAGLILRYQNSTNYIAIKITNNLLQVVKVVNGTSSVLGSTTTSVSLASGGGYYLKVDSSSTGYSIKLWNAQIGAEPSSTYTLTCTDSTGTAGQYGLYASLGSSSDTLTLYTFAVFTTPNTYYLSPTGNDNNTGTQTQPFQTFSHVQPLVLPGDKVIVLPGTYTRSSGLAFSFTASGTPYAPVQYVSSPLQQALLRTTNSSVVVSISANCVNLVGLNISSSTPSTSTGILISGATCTIQNCLIHDLQSIGAGGQAISSFGSTSTNNTITGCTIKNIGTSTDSNATSVNGITHTNGTGTITNNVLVNITGAGVLCENLSSSTLSVIVCNNLIAQCGFGGIVIWGSVGLADYMVVTNNILAYCAGASRGAIREVGTTGTHSQYMNNLLWQDTNITGTSSPIFLNNSLVATGTITADPQFVNYQPDGSGNYHTGSNSPIINNGIATNAPLVDLNGTPRTMKLTLDIGPYLYIPSAVFPTTSRRTMVFTAAKRRQV